MTQRTHRSIRNLKQTCIKRGCALALALGLLGGSLFGNSAAAAPPQLQACVTQNPCPATQTLDLAQLRQLQMARMLAGPHHPGFAAPHKLRIQP
jgi:hypothetical protein